MSHGIALRNEYSENLVDITAGSRGTTPPRT